MKTLRNIEMHIKSTVLQFYSCVLEGRQKCFCGPTLAPGPHFENLCSKVKVKPTRRCELFFFNMHIAAKPSQAMTTSY